jgi:hypothetical protein
VRVAGVVGSDQSKAAESGLVPAFGDQLEFPELVEGALACKERLRGGRARPAQNRRIAVRTNSRTINIRGF